MLTTHYMEEAEGLCDRLGIFVAGSLRCIGSPKVIITGLCSPLNNIRQCQSAVMTHCINPNTLCLRHSAPPYPAPPQELTSRFSQCLLLHMTTPEDEEQKQRTLAVVHALCPAAKQVRVRSRSSAPWQWCTPSAQQPNR